MNVDEALGKPVDLQHSGKRQIWKLLEAFCGSFFVICVLFCSLSHCAAMWSPAGKGLTSLLYHVYCV